MALIDVDWRPPKKQLRQFAAMFLVFFGIFGTVLYFKGKSLLVSQIIWGASVVIGVAGLVHPPLVWPVYVAMMALALPIGFVVSTVMMLVIYYVIMTPMGVLMRLFGYDPMRRRLDPAATSYWVPRKPPHSVRRYFRQY